MAFLMETRTSRQASNSILKKLKIAVRIRPLESDETGRIIHSIGEQVVILQENVVNKNDILRQNRGSDHQYIFDVVFGEDTSQEVIFEKTTKGLVKDVLEGYNATIFAYGASGSGKTHTMLGTAMDPGIMIRALNEIFNFIAENSLPQYFNVTMSYLEIYNENIRDLLNPDSGFLDLRENQKEKTIQVVKLSEISTKSTDEMMRLLQKGNKARTMEPTAVNKTSSRSHALLSITVRQTYPLQKKDKLKATVKQGKLFLIDLAGSERASQTKNKGKRLVEGAHINRSLLALGNCINALSGGARYVNYRDSKLTRLLKDALSGNTQTCMIAHVSPAIIHREETKNTLVYAERAKNISNKVEKNILNVSYHVSQYRTIISELRDEIAKLKSKMPEDNCLPQNQPKIDESAKNIRESQNLSHSNIDHLINLKNEIISTFREQMKLKKRMLNIENYLIELEAEADRQHCFISEWEGNNKTLYKTESYLGKMTGKPDLGSLDIDYQEMERSAGDKSLEKALIELALIEKEQEKYFELKRITETELERCREKGILLEKELPYEINSENEEKELISLILRIYELEMDKIMLKSERLTKDQVLRQKEMAILRYGRQQEICEEIITRQRQILEEEKLALPSDLKELYLLYQQEINSAVYSDRLYGNDINAFSSSEKLPPILNKRFDYLRIRTQSLENGVDDSDNSMRTGSSSAGSDWPTSPLPPIRAGVCNSSYSNNTLLSPAVSFPPISKSLENHRTTDLNN